MGCAVAVLPHSEQASDSPTRAAPQSGHIVSSTVSRVRLFSDEQRRTTASRNSCYRVVTRTLLEGARLLPSRILSLVHHDKERSRSVRIAITGGTGFVGRHLMQGLEDNGHQVTLVARKRPPFLTANVPTTFERGDVVTGVGLADIFSRHDAVVHLAAIIRERGQQTFERVNVDGTRNVVAASKKANVSHIVHLSALGVDPNPQFPYLASKWTGETAVTAGSVPFTVLRPSVLFGPGDGFFTTLARMIRLSPIVPIAGAGTSLFQPLAITDLVRCVVESLERGPRGTTHDVGGPEYLSYEQIVRTIKSELGVHRVLAHIPVPLLLPPAFVMDKLLAHPPVTPGQLGLLKKNNITRRDAVAHQFGFTAQRFADSCSYLQDY